MRNALNWGISSTLGYKPWLTRSVKELLWGYDEPLFTAAQTFMPDPPPFDRSAERDDDDDDDYDDAEDNDDNV